jgi:phosphoglycerate dehydrogenase-like enzyme
MIKAVNSNKIAGAVLDVVDAEPPAFNEDVFNEEKILVTPHISYLSVQAYGELKQRATDNLIKVLNNEPISDIAE